MAGEAGRFDGSNNFIADTGFCGAGVLGANNFPASDPTIPESLGGTVGDQLIITADLPPGETRTECQVYVSVDPATNLRLPVAFAISESFADHLVLGEMIGRPDIVDASRTLDGLRTCFGELVSFSVRTQRSYLVGGVRSGSPHRVVEGAGGACTVDTAQDINLQSRAFGGVPFANRHVAFQISARDDVTSTTSFAFSIGGVPLQLGADVGQQQTRLHYTDVDGYLYAVDTASQALVRMQLNEFLVLNTFR
ncbi:MAG: hypothetical protein IPK60_02225 [Sandaracinaceae bacterium]|nr:hypothetical protein [Sandaracinaceae bacterium]